MTRYLVTGAAGMLVQDLQRALAGREVTALTREQLDIRDVAAVDQAVEGHDVVINTAAYTDVDAAEAHEQQAWEVNCAGVGNLANASRQAGAKFVTMSTDYVFDGHGTTPYQEDALRDPINAYGRSKAMGELSALEVYSEGTFIVRTAWLYGAGGANFASTMLRLAAAQPTVSVVDDQLGQPTWSVDLAAQVVALIDSAAPAGVYHGTNSGHTSWFGFAKAIFEQAGLDPARVLATTSENFVRPAARPSYSVLGHAAWKRAGLAPMRGWRDALNAAAAAGALVAR